MSDIISKTTEHLDHPFLLVTHMVCADQQIHSEESKALRELAMQISASQRTLAEMEKILAQDENHLSVEDLARKVSPGEQSEAMSQMLAIAYVDGFCSALEREMAEQVARIWNWPAGEVQRQLAEVGAFSDTRFIGEHNQQQKPSIGARFLKGADSLLSRALVDNVAKLTGSEQKVEQIRREILLTGPEYDEAIRQCAVIADEDYKFAELALESADKALSKLAKNIQVAIEDIKYKTGGKDQATTAKEVAKQLEDTKNSLTAEIIKEIESVRESLRAKERALNHFSIAFMGRTKAGKSTLHAIITDGGWDAIGVGKQRTTRLNQVCEWKNIRIIDTPGIGAPGGQSDEEIAKSIIDESDVICYVVTNDSIQESEFGFLRLLKEKAKPLIILLNVKNNLRDSRRLEHFLKNPDKLFEMDGQSGLGGHIERIRRYAQEHYANDYFDIVPVMLLAAQLSREPEHEKKKKELFEASRMQDFLDSIRVSLVNHGAIRRSQTLLGSTVGAINNPYQWVNQQALVYEKLAQTLKNKREAIQNDIQKAAKDAREYLRQQIERIFQDAINAIPSFAEDHWNSNEIAMKLGWEQKLKALRFEKRLKIAYEETSKKFNKEVQEVLEEIGNELQLISQLGSSDFSFTEQDSNNFRDFVRIGGGLLGIAGTIIALFVAPPVGIAIAIGTGVFSMMTGMFKSKDEKRREAVINISTSLETQLNTHRQRTLQQAKGDFGKYSDSVTTNINIYFEELIAGLDAIATHLERAKKKLSGIENYLNRAYAKRIIDWCAEKYETMTDECINQIIATVERDLGRNMKIVTKSKVQQLKSLEDIKHILQEDISFSDLKSPK
ncbi:MAG: GTPase [Tychonema bourrellyi B0820]|uniref:GTPase n=1 Tax=Tychonema bourrellyi FEM_GT703 TaxID=2040638 RepID=A0A2G4F6N0_9CYAN|nr:GTPase [Tychonema bourrellyi]MDQ2098736.1 GTPase [Tychonema bourrellyi B0820]PHX57351.1 GTPase [Tychonema bourrellyi FEM_GT703]